MSPRLFFSSSYLPNVPSFSSSHVQIPDKKVKSKVLSFVCVENIKVHMCMQVVCKDISGQISTCNFFTGSISCFLSPVNSSSFPVS